MSRVTVPVLLVPSGARARVRVSLGHACREDGGKVKFGSRNGRKLVMVGTGSMLAKLRSRAAANITFVERMDFAALRKAYARTRALVMTAEEDFGITPVEAMASGRPVVAFGRGGVLDSVVPESTGLFYTADDVEALVAAVEQMERFLPHFDPRDAINQANRFAPDVFDQKMRDFAAV